ncbi:MAG TPA: hypothetical protein VJ881_04930 [Halanaerobiales bacterium]|nr:hypothetical protein [Halanaerobiales bacterium]
MTDFINFFRNEFFPDFIKFLNRILEASFNLRLTYNQLAIIGGLFLLMILSLMVEMIKKAIPLIILFIIIYYLVYGNLSFIKDLVTTVDN